MLACCNVSAWNWLTQVPASVDRAVAMASVTSGKFALPLTEDYESKQALNIAQGTVTSLRERLKQKEETLMRYENMLKQIRKDNEEELKRRQDEIVALQGRINHFFVNGFLSFLLHY